MSRIGKIVWLLQKAKHLSDGRKKRLRGELNTIINSAPIKLDLNYLPGISPLPINYFNDEKPTELTAEEHQEIREKYQF